MKKELGHEAIYDARQLGTPRMLVLGLQHMFAIFGATVLVPILVQGYGLITGQRKQYHYQQKRC